MTTTHFPMPCNNCLVGKIAVGKDRHVDKFLYSSGVAHQAERTSDCAQLILMSIVFISALTNSNKVEEHVPTCSVPQQEAS